MNMEIATMMPQHFNFEVLIIPAEDLPGVWLALCPRLALCTQGNSPVHAREMMEEAISLVFEDDAADGLDPLNRQNQASEFWNSIRAQIEDVRLRGKTADLSKAEVENPRKRLLVMVSVSVSQGKTIHGQSGFDLRLCG